jgi:hypothetical protein
MSTADTTTSNNVIADKFDSEVTVPPGHVQSTYQILYESSNDDARSGVAKYEDDSDEEDLSEYHKSLLGLESASAQDIGDHHGSGDYRDRLRNPKALPSVDSDFD